MKKLFLLSLTLSIFFTYGQRKEKIKGNREVLIKKFTIPSFNSIEVGEKFEIELQKSTDTTRIVVETDDNLFDVIHFNVEEGILKFNTSKEIVKKKRLKITVFVPENFSSIKVFEKAKVFNEEAFGLDHLKIEALQRGKINLNLDIKKELNIYLTDKSKFEFEGTAKTVEMKTNESSEAEAKWTVKNINMDIHDHSLVKLKGKADNSKIKTGQKTELKAENFVNGDAVVETEDKSSAEINVKNHLALKAKGNSEVYIYNHPKINLKVFTDNAILYKK